MTPDTILHLLFSFLLATCDLTTGICADKPIRNEPLCGAECLYIALTTLGIGPNRFQQLCDELGKPHAEGYSLLELQQAAAKHGCHAECVNIGFDQLADLASNHEVILHMTPGHFMLCNSANEDEVMLMDSRRGFGKFTQSKLAESWTGNCLIVSTSPIVIERSSTGKWKRVFVVAIVAIVISFTAYAIRRQMRR